MHITLLFRKLKRSITCRGGQALFPYNPCFCRHHQYKYRTCMCSGIFDAVTKAAFQVGSIITTTGFSTTDFDKWPEFSKGILTLLMFIGACAGSTGGGIKKFHDVL